MNNTQRIEVLEKALEPFASFAEVVDNGHKIGLPGAVPHPDSTPLWSGPDGPVLTLGHMRTALKALEGEDVRPFAPRRKKEREEKPEDAGKRLAKGSIGILRKALRRKRGSNVEAHDAPTPPDV